MIIKQVSVFVENETGKLEEVTEVLFQKGINVSALNIAETADYGVLRMVVDHTGQAVEALKEQSFPTRVTDVLSISAPDVPGSLNQILIALSQAGINVAYMYGYSAGGTARFILKVEDVEAGEAVLNGLF